MNHDQALHLGALEKQKGIFVCWYPKETNPFTHLHLRINKNGNDNDRIYFSFKSKIHLFDLNNATFEQKSYVERVNRYEFKIRANSHEINQIYNFLNKKKTILKCFSCSSSTCAILYRFNLLSVPFPISQSPLATAIYLFRQKALGNPQIQNIQFIGENQNRIKVIATPAVFGELAIVIGLVILVTIIIFQKFQTP